MSSKIIVLDANILIRAVLGKRVKEHLLNYFEIIDFFIPESCIKEAEKYLPIIFEKRKLSSTIPLEILTNLKNILKIIDEKLYLEFADEAKQRMKNRDICDWPIVASALLFNCPIWTEDQDFFGVGIPVWTTDRIHIFLNSQTVTQKNKDFVEDVSITLE